MGNVLTMCTGSLSGWRLSGIADLPQSIHVFFQVKGKKLDLNFLADGMGPSAFLRSPRFGSVKSLRQLGCTNTVPIGDLLIHSVK